MNKQLTSLATAAKAGIIPGAQDHSSATAEINGKSVRAYAIEDSRLGVRVTKVLWYVDGAKVTAANVEAAVE